ncbi:MAG: NADH:flavin oxidoreductase/NADH oxidase family protein [Hyphomonadaceae bacterium]|nr:NADH:flavin oxidoreductase/NADH oxidase family protein [Hyphomonadaceae bacterium]
MTATLSTPLPLPCGATLPNRLAKAAMTEGLADSAGVPTVGLERLYALWSDGGCGLLISGNIIIDADHLERPGNVVLDRAPDDAMKAAFAPWIAAATAGGTHLWAQISHAGRQTQKLVNPTPFAPSSTALGLPGGQFGTPIAMSEGQIEAVIARYAQTALWCKELGFTGAQIHAAHGYLLSSFLNPLANRRLDRFGGPLEHRARPLLEAVRQTRVLVGSGFPISVKLNSADFQQGGLTQDDSMQIALWLEAAGVDLLEISGGNYEAPEMMGMDGLEAPSHPNQTRPPKSERTLAREAYFLDFARALRAKTRLPIMLTGGLRSRAGMQAALDEGVDVIGVARPLGGQPDCVHQLLAGKIDALPAFEDHLQTRPGLFGPQSPIKLIRTINGFAGIQWFYAQFYRIGRGGSVDLKLSPLKALAEVTGLARKLVKARGGTPISPV